MHIWYQHLNIYNKQKAARTLIQPQLRSLEEFDHPRNPVLLLCISNKTNINDRYGFIKSTTSNAIVWTPILSIWMNGM